MNSDELISTFSVDEIITELAMQREDGDVGYIPRKLEDKFDIIRREYGEVALNRIKSYIMLQLLKRQDVVSSSFRYPQIIEAQYEKNADRIAAISRDDAGWAEYSQDAYWKDLALVRRTMFPAVAQIVEKNSGFGIRQGINCGILQTIKFFSFLLSHKGSKGYYQIHTHLSMLEAFNEEGWNECYMCIAEMLKVNPDIKGFFGGSWFYDPALKEISPKLSYLREIPLSGGARSFQVGLDTTGNALATSKTRQELFKKGDYTPRSYLLIWPRKELLAWAEART